MRRARAMHLRVACRIVWCIRKVVVKVTREPRLLERDAGDAGNESSEQQPREYTRSLAARDVI